MSSLPVLTEVSEGKLFVGWLRMKGYKFFHAPSETGSSDEAKRRAIRMKQAGTVKGWPDYIVIKNNQLIAIELKRSKKSLSRVSPEQTEWLEALANCGMAAAVCYGADSAIEFVESVGSSSDQPDNTF